jgi:hypothetical protein
MPILGFGRGDVVTGGRPMSETPRAKASGDSEVFRDLSE